MKGSCTHMKTKLTTLTIAQSIYVINKQVKRVSDPNVLYKLKHEAIAKLLRENKAKKLYLHRYSRKLIFVVVECEGYLFHHPASNDDLKEFEYQEVAYDRPNPRTDLRYLVAKRNLINYVTDDDSSNKAKKLLKQSVTNPPPH